MKAEEYIESGLLELYVAGLLTKEENEAIYKAMQDHPQIYDEVQKIEAAYLRLSEAVAPDIEASFDSIKGKIGDRFGDSPIKLEKRKPQWPSYIGWAASVFLAAALIWVVGEREQLLRKIETVNSTNQTLEEQIQLAQSDLKEAERLLEILRDKDILSVPLSGQVAFPEAYATIYWDKLNGYVLLDAQGLPEPPEGKVYQLWSLKLNPLQPTSLGVISNFSSDSNKIFDIANQNESEAFGITLEPEGGSDSPTLEQLYTLGAVPSSP